MEAIKNLRERSGAPIAEVKAALTEASWDSEAAYQNLRKKGLAAAVKKATKRAAEGLVGFASNSDSSGAVLVEVNSETDFVARTEEFQSLVSSVAQAALAHCPTDRGASAEMAADALEGLQLADGRSAGAATQDVAGVLRENIRLRRGHWLACPGGVVGAYLHVSPQPGLGRMGALVALHSPSHPIDQSSRAEAEALGKQLCMHIVATRPQYLDRGSVSADVLEREREVLRQQGLKTGKPPVIVEKMVEGRLKKFYEEVCLLEQRFVMDDTQTISQVLRTSQLAKGTLQIPAFIRLQCGEGIESQPAMDFAAQVQQAVEAA
ncbi:hypothetical protein WJX73_008981 [Symbiochloris irregularis]|uniref:Elongation factor Ts, mitochondrial n=1 Tax=Symbiochloris irregularis TaxID=706552 RepID=A0AAW1P6Q7_9CHLO